MLRLKRIWRALLRRDRLERDLDDELRTTLELLIEEKQRAGLTAGEARRAARLELGSAESLKDGIRDARGMHLIDGLRRDVHLAVRSLRAAPLLAGVAVVSLALAIGANTAIFSIANGLILRPLPVRDPGGLVLLTDTRVAPRVRVWEYSMWEQLQQRPQLFEAAAAWSFTRFNLANGGESQFVEGLWATGSFFDTLGVGAVLGRTFSDLDDQRGGGAGGPVTVISDSYWRRAFGAAVDVIGRTVRLNGVPFTIVGVTPPDFFGAEVGRAFDFIAPLHTEPLVRGSDAAIDNPGANFLTIIARRRPAQSTDTATAALRRLQPEIRAAAIRLQGRAAEDALIDRYLRDPLLLVDAQTGYSNLRLQYARPVLLIAGLAALVLLIACVNIANLLLARAMARRQELQVRLALGASRWRLARQLFTESFVLALAGAALGVALAPRIARFVISQLSTPVNVVVLGTTVDRALLAFAVVVTMLTAVLFGTMPALRAARLPLVDTLKERGPAVRTRATPSRCSGKKELLGELAGWMIALQVAFSVVLVVTAGLFIRSFGSLAGRELGFDPERVVIVTIDPERSPVDASGRPALFERVRLAVRALPDVADAAISLRTPVASGGFTPQVAVGGAASGVQQEVFGNLISPGWFGTFGTPVVMGRDVTERDRRGAPRVALVNETFARRYFGNATPVGRTITIWPGTPRALSMEIVGVAADALYFSAREPIPPSWYAPMAQFDVEGFPFSPVRLSVRSRNGSPLQLTRAIEAAVGSVDPQLELTFRPLAEQVRTSLVRERLMAQLGGFFGALALLLAGLGLYGVTAYTVSRRRTEIGIRMALGAAPGRVIGLMIGRVSMLVLVGVVAGTAASMWASTLAAGIIYGVEPGDPGVVAGGVITLAATAALAAWLPTRRAVRINPAAALRES